MDKTQADVVWSEVVTGIRDGSARFEPWRHLRSSLESNLREYANNLLRGFSQGLIDYAAYSPTPESVVVVPRMKVPNAQFVFIYRNGNTFEYFGIKKEDDKIIETTKTDVKLGFAEVMNSLG